MDNIEIKGDTVIEDSVVASLAGMAAREVEGVVGMGGSTIRRLFGDRMGGSQRAGIQVAMDNNEVVADLTLTVRYGYNIPNIVQEVRKKVATSLMDNAGLTVKEVNVHIANIEFPDSERSFAIRSQQGA